MNSGDKIGLQFKNESKVEFIFMPIDEQQPIAEMSLAKDKTGWRGLPHEMHRCCLDFTTPGFAPLRRVNKMFKAFEDREERVSAVAALLKERKQRIFEYRRCDHKIAQRLPYVTSVTLVE